VRPLLLLEVVSVVAFGVLAVTELLPARTTVRPIDVATLAVGPAEETWSGIFIGDRHVGYSVSRESPIADGGRLYEERSTFALGSMGTTQQVTTAGTAVTDAAGHLVQFDFLLSSPVLVVAHGEVRPGEVHVSLRQGDSTSELDIPVSEPPALSMTAANVVKGRELHPGDVFEVPYFNPVTVTPSTMKVTVQAPELLPNGEVGHWLELDGGGMTTRRLVDADGEVLREEAALGMQTVRMTKAEAQKVDSGEAPDLVALARVPLVGFIDPARPFGPLTLDVSGVDAAKLPQDGDIQRVEGSRVTLTGSDPATWPTLPVAAAAGADDTEPTATLPADNEEIVAKAREVIGDAPDRATAARRLTDFVYGYVQKVPTIGIPNGLEVLHTAQGDCNEHTALYVSLARAAGIPARIAAGLVYAPTLGQAFYYHAWPEVRLGPDESWVAVDPTFGEFPAHATHLQLVTGDLDRQLEIMSVMGKLRLSVAANAQPEAGAAVPVPDREPAP
jgi:hypothetical protein